jgi:hypothetical protein
MKNLTRFFLLITLFSFCFLACDKDENPITDTTFEYDSQKHVYGTLMSANDLGWENQEVIIDIESGELSIIEGTTKAGGGIDFPNGTKDLTDFEQKRRIFKDLATNNMVVQDLETGEKEIIELNDSDGISIGSANYFVFGDDNNTVYVLTSVADIWSVDLSTKSIELIQDQVSLDLNNYQIEDFRYHRGSQKLLIFGKRSNSSTSDAYAVFTFDVVSKTVELQHSLPALFGYQVHPDGERIFGLTLPSDDEGFRLTEILFSNGSFDTKKISNEDLAIDQLSPYIQTIHTASNSYVCRGGSNSIEMPETILYQIDLTTGELLGEATLAKVGHLLKLEGE